MTSKGKENVTTEGWNCIAKKKSYKNEDKKNFRWTIRGISTNRITKKVFLHIFPMYLRNKVI